MHDLCSVKRGLGQVLFSKGYKLPFKERSGHKAQDSKLSWQPVYVLNIWAISPLYLGGAFMYMSYCMITGVSCGPPGNGSNADKEVTSELYEGVATYTCITGYETSDPLTLTCDETGAWSGDPPSCERECNNNLSHTL